jgi:putative addiction module component (TIGR02574 family)
MADSVHTLGSAALKLDEKDRAELARILLESLGPSDDCDYELEWAEEAERRYTEVKEGRVQAISSKQVFEEARARLS